MSHHAQINENNIVTQVIVTGDDPNTIEWLEEAFGGTWIKTSYNTRGNVHYGSDGEPDGGQPLRYNYAIAGGHYNPEADVFYDPSPFPSWVLDKTTFTWSAPMPKPFNVFCVWNENTKTWDEILDSRPTDGAYLWDDESQSWYLANPLAKENNV